MPYRLSGLRTRPQKRFSLASMESIDMPLSQEDFNTTLLILTRTKVFNTCESERNACNTQLNSSRE